uniref:YadA-like family protein n=1 Tax=Veillonella ratti TaxID=103892 RepID=UPI0019D19F16
TAKGLLANANGVKSLAHGNASLALGTEAISYGSSSIAIGTDALAGNTSGADSYSGDGAIAIGLGSRANENLSIALGGNAQSSAISSTAIGAFARSNGISATAIGAGSYANFIGDIALGTGSYVTSETNNRAQGGSLAIGYTTRTVGGQALAIGSGAKANADRSVIIGVAASNKLPNINTVAVGSGAAAYNTGAIAIGGYRGALTSANSTVSWGLNSVGIGTSAAARADYSVALGDQARGYGFESIAIGQQAQTVGNAVAIGSNAVVGEGIVADTSTLGGVAIGSYSQSLGQYGTKGYDPLKNVQVSDMSTVLSETAFNNYTSKETIVQELREKAESAEGVYKSYYMGLMTQVNALERRTDLTDTQKKAEMEKIYNTQKAYGEAFNSAYDALYNSKTDSDVNIYNKAASTWEATGSAFAIGNAERGLTRQITGVAAGTQDTDAVNVAQLKRSRVTLEAGNNITITDTIVDKSTGIVYKVNGLRTDITADNTLELTSNTDNAGVTTYNLGLSDNLTTIIKNAADKNLTNLSEDGENVVKNLAKSSVAVAKADNEQYITVSETPSTETNKTTYQVGLDVEGLKAGLAAGNNALATKADVTNLNNGIQDQITKLSESQLTADQVKTLAQGSVDVKGGANVDIDTKDNGGVKTFTVSVSDANIKSAVQADLDEKLNKDGTNLTKELITSLKDKLGVNDANQSLDQLNGQIEKAETRIEEAHTRIDTTNTRVDSIDTKVQTIDGRVTTVEGNVSTLRTDVDNISANVSTLNTNVDTLTTNVNTLATDLGNLTNDVNTLSENVGAIASDVSAINNRVGKLDQRLDKVGASAAALAALHPLQFDEEDKFTVSAGVGNYKGEQAMALGAFYQANEDTLFSVGGTLGDENMVNLGVSLRFGSKGEGQRPSGPKAVRALTTEVASLQAKNASLENTVATQQDRLAQQEAELAAQRQLIEQLVAKVGL